MSLTLLKSCFSSSSKSGKLRLEVNYVNGEKHGLSRFYHLNGQLYKETNYQNGKKNGSLTIFYDDGQKWAEGDFKNNHVCLGFKEYKQDGRSVNMPEIMVENIQYISQNKIYTLTLSLSNTSRKVKFFTVKEGSACLDIGSSKVIDEYTVNGKSEIICQPTNHNFIDVYAHYTTPYKNKVLLTKRVSLP